MQVNGSNDILRKARLRLKLELFDINGAFLQEVFAYNKTVYVKRISLVKRHIYKWKNCRYITQ